jgi:hypothetical protein
LVEGSVDEDPSLTVLSSYAAGPTSHFKAETIEKNCFEPRGLLESFDEE